MHRNSSKKTRQLKGVLDSIKAAIWMRDTESRFVLANQNFTDLFGISDPEDLIGKAPDEAFPPDIATQFRENDRRVLQTEEPIEIEEEVATQSGNRTFLTRITPLFAEEGGIYATCGIRTQILRVNKEDSVTI